MAVSDADRAFAQVRESARVGGMVHKFMNTTERLAEVVRSQRHALGLTQAEVATKAGVGRRFVVDLESGHPRAELGKTLAVLKAVDVDALAIPVDPNAEEREDDDR